MDTLSLDRGDCDLPVAAPVSGDRGLACGGGDRDLRVAGNGFSSWKNPRNALVGRVRYGGDYGFRLHPVPAISDSGSAR